MTVVDINKTAPFKTEYGETYKQCLEMVYSIPIQLVGAVPCRVFENGCLDDPAICLHVFASEDAVNSDQSGFLFRFPGRSGNTFILEKEVAGVWTVASANMGSAEGKKYNFADFPAYFAYSGFLIDWKKVFDLHGKGKYRLRIDTADEAVKLYSYCFCLDQYSCSAANKTVKIESYQKGFYDNAVEGLLDIQFDLVNITDGWYDSIRLPGIFTPTLEKEEENTFANLESTRKLVRRRGSKLYRLQVLESNYEILERLHFYMLGGQNVQITDFTTNNLHKFGQLQVTPVEAYTSGQNFANQKITLPEFRLKGEMIEFAPC